MHAAIGARVESRVWENFGNAIARVDPHLERLKILEGRGKNADQGHRLAIQNNLFSEDGAITAEFALPETIGEQAGPRGAGLAFGGQKIAAQGGLDAECGK